ncbi:Uu.00g075280.m01.CDS01 [Anthostomella pinea]|uniref:Uu.00g075280.m01.CDS01 n=1 Tax=Anthostomella pinea TaxID=933095 RepID=A0AAI8VVP4_9PEZI|nr:Uu.00g075280.m01.CDS01 [Anthostomella pinea]
MKLPSFFTTLAVSPALAAAYSGSWSPATAGDVRAPCPMLNTLANHGYLRHSGKDITLNETITTLQTVLNVDPVFSTFLFEKALTTNPYPNATTFSLEDLGNHNILEHDASLSRADWFFGSVLLFNETVFAETKSHLTADIISLEMAAKARLGRVETSNATNPTFSLSPLGMDFDFGETAAYIMVLGDGAAGTVRKDRVEYLFENERLPFELGWVRPNTTITLDGLIAVANRLFAAQGLTSEEAAKRVRSSRDMHFGH